MYYASFGILAILILIVENHDVILKQKGTFDAPAWSVYRRFLFAVLAYCLIDALWGILETRKLAVLLFADTTVYFVLISVGILFWVEYTVAYLEENTAFGRFLITVGRVVAGAITLLATFNTFTPLLFTVEADGVYRALPGTFSKHPGYVIPIPDYGRRPVFTPVVKMYIHSLRQRSRLSGINYKQRVRGKVNL